MSHPHIFRTFSKNLIGHSFETYLTHESNSQGFWHPEMTFRVMFLTRASNFGQNCLPLSSCVRSFMLKGRHVINRKPGMALPDNLCTKLGQNKTAFESKKLVIECQLHFPTCSEGCWMFYIVYIHFSRRIVVSRFEIIKGIHFCSFFSFFKRSKGNCKLSLR